MLSKENRGRGSSKTVIRIETSKSDIADHVWKEMPALKPM